MTDHMTDIVTFPLELLVGIFEYCSASDLARLAQVCKRFHEIIQSDILWRKKTYLPLVTNQKSKRFLDRCNQVLCDRSKWRVSYNWQYGKYVKLLFPQRMKVIPKIRMKSDELWWCSNNVLCGFNRAKPFNTVNNLIYKYVSNISDFGTFVLMKDFIVTGDSNGYLKYWLFNKDVSVHITRAHSDDINTIDATSEVILTSSIDRRLKVYPAPVIDDMIKCYDDCLSSITVIDRIWSMKADVKGTRFAIGTSGNTTKPLQIFDIEDCRCLMQLSHNWRHGAGILDIVWEDSHTILTCGYDTYIRKWDLRCGRCVNSWVDPNDSTLYCISSDYNYTMITGTQFNCMAVLWDQRQREYMQFYFMKCPGIYNKSPIYSLDFDSTHLYCATDRYLAELDFYGNTKRSFNYKESVEQHMGPILGVDREDTKTLKKVHINMCHLFSSEVGLACYNTHIWGGCQISFISKNNFIY